jgi:hypothetical protein
MTKGLKSQKNKEIENAIDRAIDIYIARKNLCFFTKFMDEDYLLPNHIQLIAEKLEKIESGELKRLIINMPPRRGKSTIVSKYFLSWYLGKNPSNEIIIASYGSELATEFTSFSRDLLQEDDYKLVFPDISLKQDTKRKDNWKTNKKGSVVGVGIGGAITGKGAHLAIIDDPIKNDEEARSLSTLEKHWSWYSKVLRTRLAPDGAIILIMTRWAKQDLAGKLLKSQMKGAEEWELLKLPEISPKGKPLWPDRFPKSEAEAIKKIDEETYYTLYQQEPRESINQIFENPNYVNLKDFPKDIILIAYLDPAFGGKDSSAFCVGGLYDRDIYIKYAWTWKKPLDQSYDIIFNHYKESGAQKLWIEDNSAQKALLDVMRTKGLDPGGVTNMRPKPLRIGKDLKKEWNNIYFCIENVEDNFMDQILNYEEPADLGSNNYPAGVLVDAPDSLAGLVKKLKGGDLQQHILL